MTKSKDTLKEEIKAELRHEMGAGGSAFFQYLNLALLVAVGFVAGFVIGQRYERNLPRRVARAGGPGAQAQAQQAEAGQLPADHPPIESVAGGDPMKAVLDLRERLEKDPNDLEALVGLANMNFDIGRFDMAVEHYQRAVAIDPTNPNVITDMGIALRRLSRFDDAVQAFRMASSLDPGHWQSRLNLGIVLMVDKRDDRGALAAFEEYLALGLNLQNRGEVEQEVKRLRQQIAGEARLHGPEEPEAGEADAPTET